MSFLLSGAQARAIWLRAQRLDRRAPFGTGPSAVKQAIAHLGYVQIDTINVIERSHHHILQSRIPDYASADLEHVQSVEKSAFEYWTHALSYVPTSDYRYFMPAMARHRDTPRDSFASIAAGDYAALLKRIRKDGPISLRDIDEEPVEKTHLWDSRKPSRRVLRFGFFTGDLTISKRTGMLKSYDLTSRHFGWGRRPAPASDTQFAQYLLARALRAQGVVSLDSICYGNLKAKTAVAPLIDAQVRRKRLVPVHLDSHPKIPLWVEPNTLDSLPEISAAPLIHILSPFDPLIIQRKRLSTFFGYDHKFEAYVPPPKRVFGYFALPVLAGDRIVAALDLKTDRKAGQLLVQKWTWVAPRSSVLKAAIEDELDRFERFQLAAV